MCEQGLRNYESESSLSSTATCHTPYFWTEQNFFLLNLCDAPQVVMPHVVSHKKNCCCCWWSFFFLNSTCSAHQFLLVFVALFSLSFAALWQSGRTVDTKKVCQRYLSQSRCHFTPYILTWEVIDDADFTLSFWKWDFTQTVYLNCGWKREELEETHVLPELSQQPSGCQGVAGVEGKSQINEPFLYTFATKTFCRTKTICFLFWLRNIIETHHFNIIIHCYVLVSIHKDCFVYWL